MYQLLHLEIVEKVPAFNKLLVSRQKHKKRSYLESFLHTIFWENESKSAAVRGGGNVVGNAIPSLDVGREKGLGRRIQAEEVSRGNAEQIQRPLGTEAAERIRG